jgi:hypothetical protein
VPEVTGLWAVDEIAIALVIGPGALAALIGAWTWWHRSRRRDAG